MQFFREARWIWLDDGPPGYNQYVEARQRFDATGDSADAVLTITADALYQVWVNGTVVGHGPAKSAAGRRSVDRYELAGELRPGVNEIVVLTLSVGVGTMTYCLGDPGVIFEVSAGGRVLAASGSGTEMRIAPDRNPATVRRWILPCLEDVNMQAAAAPWQAAVVVDRHVELYARRVPLPSREVLPVRSVVAGERVTLPTFQLAQRVRPYLNDARERLRHNTFDTPATFITDIVSPVAQELRFVPTMGSAAWYFAGRKIIDGTGWGPWLPDGNEPVIQLRAGANRLIGLHRHDHFEQICLAGFSEQPVAFRNPFGEGAMQIVPGVSDEPPQDRDWEALRPSMPAMDPAHSMVDANAQDLVLGAEPVPGSAFVPVGDAASPLELPPAPPGTAARIIVDLGTVHNGWLAFEAEGSAGSRLIFSMFEGIDAGPPLRPHWAFGCNNALTYRLGEGFQRFESFLPYGMRYIAIHHTGEAPVRLHRLRVLTANCGSRRQGFLQCNEALLNQVFELAEQSVISGVDDTFTDCPTFEQVNWNFDNRTAFLGEALTCANAAVTANSIELFAEDPEFTGLVRSQYPSAWDSYIPLWSLHWILWCADFHRLTGDGAFVQRVFPRIRAGLDEALAKRDARGLLAWDDAWHFVEWCRGRDDNHPVNGAEQGVFAATLAGGAELAHIVGETALAARWEQAREELVAAIDRHLWQPDRAAYADSLHADGTVSPVSSQVTNALLALHVAAPDRARALAERVRGGDSALLPYGSPYGLYYILELFDRFSFVEEIFAAIRHRWGDMARAGDRTTWETFAEYGGHGGFPTRSRCHPFAAYVAKYLVKYLLGVEPLAPGYAAFRVEPKPPTGIDTCHGAVPTPHGLIRVGWTRRADGLDVQVDAPPTLNRR